MVLYHVDRHSGRLPPEHYGLGSERRCAPYCAAENFVTITIGGFTTAGTSSAADGGGTCKSASAPRMCGGIIVVI